MEWAANPWHEDGKAIFMPFLPEERPDLAVEDDQDDDGGQHPDADFEEGVKKV